MFTGIVESLGSVTRLEKENENLHITIRSAISAELKIDQSVSHNGVCLTVVELGENWHRVTAIAETLRRSTVGKFRLDDLVNLERCMPATGRFDGHIVQGHVDQTAVCTRVQEEGGSWIYEFSHALTGSAITVEKGSICINGVSLTVVDSGVNTFSVAIIPYTWEHTNFRQLATGDQVNLEFDIIGKYISKIMAQRA